MQRRTTPESPVASDPAQRRVMRTLLTSQVLGGVGVGSGVSVVGLLAYELSGREALSGLSSTAATLGAAAVAVPMARVVATRGRRPGIVSGYGIGALGALVAVIAAIAGSFPLHVVASFLFGSATASNLQARFAATDLVDADHRGRMLSTVVWATTVGAVLGPNLTGPGERVAGLLGLPALAGAYVFALAAFGSAALVQWVGLRPDPLLLARERAERATGEQVRSLPVRQAWSVIRRRPDALLAVHAIAAANAIMVGVMVMTPVHMKHDGAELRLVGFTISLHILGMFAFSPLVGRLVDRIGARPTIALGAAQLVIACLLVATTSARGSLPFTMGMVLLGTGWSFCLIAGSSLLVAAADLAERPALQGFSDTVMNLAGGIGGILAGVVLGLAGYAVLAWSAMAVLLLPAWVALRPRGVPHRRT